jgi:hypothetical protein
MADANDLVLTNNGTAVSDNPQSIDFTTNIDATESNGKVTVKVKDSPTFTGTVTAAAFVAPKKSVSGSGATVTLTAAQTGSTVLMDRAAGIVFTLPTAAAGLAFDFYVTTAVTSNAYKVITSVGTELLIGGLLSDDTDSSDALAMFNANGSSHIAVSMNGTTTGGLVGTRIRVTCLSATKWFVEGTVYGSGTVATPFATS